MCAVPLDGAVEIELFRRARARELSQAAQRQLDVARAELDLVVEILELALVPHLDRAEIAVLVLADAHAFRIVAIGAVRRGAGGADPFVAALVALLLFGEALAQRLHAIFPSRPWPRSASSLPRSDISRRAFFSHSAGMSASIASSHRLQPLEHVTEHAVELVDVALVLHQRGARQVVEVIDAARRRDRRPWPPAASNTRAMSPAHRPL